MQKSKKIIIATGIFLIIFFVFFYASRITPEEISPQPDKTINVAKATLEINNAKYESEITEKISVYDFMSKLRSAGKIDFTEKNYTGIGEFIVAINGVKGNMDRNWIYYVNGKKAKIGVSNYKINTGDIVSWKYEKSY